MPVALIGMIASIRRGLCVFCLGFHLFDLPMTPCFTIGLGPLFLLLIAGGRSFAFTTILQNPQHFDLARRNHFSRFRTDSLSSRSTDDGATERQPGKRQQLCQEDIIWKLKPPSPPTSTKNDDNTSTEDTKAWKQGDFVISWPPPPENSANTNQQGDVDHSYLLWLSSVRAAVQTVAFGKDTQVMLEAWLDENYDDEGTSVDKQEANMNEPTLATMKVGRFGITVESGPPHPLIQSAAQELFDGDEQDNDNILVRTAAIIYMFVEPAYRGRNLGQLALEVISFLHGSVADCDYTLMVADDDGSGKLVQWYEREGDFVRAPMLQELMGSPNEAFGVSMMGPTSRTAHGGKSSSTENGGFDPPPLPKDCSIEWYYDVDLVETT